MTIREALSRIRQLRPSSYDDALLTSWLSELDGRTRQELHAWQADAPTGSLPYEDGNGALLIPYPYDGVYLHWLSAKIDQWNGETERYENDMQLFNEQYAAYCDGYKREHDAAQPTIYI